MAILYLSLIHILYIVATRKTRYVPYNEKGLGCGLNKGKMCRLICFREQSKIGSKRGDMFRDCDINQHVSSHIESICVLTKREIGNVNKKNYKR